MNRASPGLTPRVVAALATVCVVWGSTYFAIRVGLESFPPMLMGSVRFAVAGAAMYAVLRLRGAPAPTARQWRSSVYTGFLFLTIGNGAVNVAEKNVSSSVAAILVATMPLWAVVVGRLFGERASSRELVGVVLGMAGVVVMNAGGDLRGAPLGAAFGLAAPIAWATGSVLARRLDLPGGAMGAASQMLCGGAIMAIVGLASGERLASVPSARAVAAVGYLVVFGSMVGFSAYGYLLRNTRPTIASSYAYVNPLVAIVLGTVLGGERVGAATLAGAAIIVGSVALLHRAKSAKPAPEPAPEHVEAAALSISGASCPNER